MSRQIFLVLLIGCAVIFGAAWYIHRAKTHAVSGGEVFVRNQPADATKPNSASPATPPDQTSQPEQPLQNQQPAAATQADTEALNPPPTDSINRNPPNGIVFAGTGKYQLYRQGDITWRLDTNTGQSCILFATDAEWRKPRVYQHGCGHS